MRGIVLKRAGGRKGSTRRVGTRGVEIGLMPSKRVPGAGVVISHKVPEVEMFVHGLEMELLVVLGACGTGYCEEHCVAMMTCFELLEVG